MWQAVSYNAVLAAASVAGFFGVRLHEAPSYLVVDRLGQGERAPVPHDPRISLEALPDETYAVLRYAGSAQSFRQREAELLVRLDGTGWQAVGRPFTQFYDPPFTVPALRRNEAAVCVAKVELPAPA
jgi:hypothetical protein